MFRFLKRYASSDDRRESQHAIVRLRGVKFLHRYGGTGAGTVQEQVKLLLRYEGVQLYYITCSVLGAILRCCAGHEGSMRAAYCMMNAFVHGQSP